MADHPTPLHFARGNLARFSTNANVEPGSRGNHWPTIAHHFISHMETWSVLEQMLMSNQETGGTTGRSSHTTSCRTWTLARFSTNVDVEPEHGGQHWPTIPHHCISHVETCVVLVHMLMSNQETKGSTGRPSHTTSFRTWKLMPF